MGVFLVCFLFSYSSSKLAQTEKNLPAMQETPGPIPGSPSLTQEKGMATHSSILAWRTPWTEKPDELQSMQSQRVGHSWANNTFMLFFFFSILAQNHKFLHPTPLVIGFFWFFLSSYCSWWTPIIPVAPDLNISSTLNPDSSAAKESTCNSGHFLGWEDPLEKG